MGKEQTTFQIVRSDRKSCAIQVKQDGTVLVRAPRKMSEKDILELVRQKADWIARAKEKVYVRNQTRAQLPPLTYEDIKRLADQALAVIPPRVSYFASLMKVKYGRITVRNQKSRWGSCSSEGNLNFNCLLMLTPSYVVDYVIVHELCHRKHMNHSAAFWAEVKRVLPQYEVAYDWLKANGGALIERMKKGGNA